MEIYIVLFFLLLFASIIPNKFQYPYVAILLLLIGIAGFRGMEVGVDTNNYRSIFFWINDKDIDFIEPGWKLLNRVVYLGGGSFLTLLTITSFFTLLPVFYVSKKASPYIFFSIFIFYSLHLYFGAFNVMRQYFAVSIILLAYYYLSQEKKLIAFACFCVAISIHYSCFWAIVVYFWQKHNLTSLRVFIYTVLGFVLGSIINEDVVKFLTFSEYNNVADVRENTFFIALFTIVMDFFMSYFISLNKKFTLNSFWGKLFVLSILVFNSTYSLSFNARIYSLFAISQIIFFPLFLKNTSTRNRILPAILITMYVSAQFWRMLLANANTIIPYEINYQDLNNSFFSFILWLV